ncbi:MAG TPA: HAD family phosphatase [Kiritimatiellia bacterium]|nr:HAD family phosphatase [Kiritimatiellia bacterium]HMP32888.1 HAD family phosphatase [Kiritimatiellia bacterium]
MHLQAVIFDFDGIVVDSEPLHHQAFERVLAPAGFGFSWDDYVADYLGFDDRDVFRERFKRAGAALDPLRMAELMADKAQAFVDIVRAGGVTPYPGVVELITGLSECLPIAICSGALQSDIDPILDILGLTGRFPVMVTADQVSVSKPDPESYRTAFARLAARFPERVTDPARCVAIEDTPAGIAAATGAGLKVLAVTNTYAAASLGAAHRIVDSLAAVEHGLLDAVASA